MQLHYLLRRYKDQATRRLLFMALLPFMRQWARAYRAHQYQLRKKDYA